MALASHRQHGEDEASLCACCAALQVMLRDAEGWEQPVWHIFGQRHLAPRKSAYFELANQQASCRTNAFESLVLCMR